MFSCEFCEIFKYTFFEKHMRTYDSLEIVTNTLILNASVAFILSSKMFDGSLIQN